MNKTNLAQKRKYKSFYNIILILKEIYLHSKEEYKLKLQ